jgi:ankyrin repeat protein
MPLTVPFMPGCRSAAEQLPSELLIQILLLVPDPDISSLSGVCKSWHKAVSLKHNPNVWGRIIVESKGPEVIMSVYHLKSDDHMPEKEYTHRVEALLHAGSDEYTPAYLGTTPLWTAVLDVESVLAVEVLLKAGADPNALVCVEEGSLLNHVCVVGDEELVEKLLAYGADVRTSYGETGRTPLYDACRLGHVSLVGMLIEAGLVM